MIFPFPLKFYLKKTMQNSGCGFSVFFIDFSTSFFFVFGSISHYFNCYIAFKYLTAWIILIFFRNFLAIPRIVFWPDGCHDVLIVHFTIGLTSNLFSTELAIVLKHKLDHITLLLVVYTSSHFYRIQMGILPENFRPEVPAISVLQSVCVYYTQYFSECIFFLSFFDFWEAGS